MKAKETPLISVVIPVYKVEKYLDRCICSVIKQTYSNLEIILINDGSPDNCPHICDDWAKKDKRIKVIHKNNEGLSSARNAGLKQSKGEFICFVDSDDWIEPDMIESLLDAIIGYGTLVAVCGRYVVYNEGKNTDKCYLENGLMSSAEFAANMLAGKNCDCAVWDKLYHKSLWTDIEFPHGRIYEDIAVQYKLILKTENVAVVGKPLYNYFRHAESITQAEFNEHLLDYPFNTRILLNDIKIIKPELYEPACWMHTKALQNVLKKIAMSDAVTYKTNIEILKNFSEELLLYKNVWKTSGVFSGKDKLLCGIFSRWYVIRLVYRIKRALKKFVG